MIIFRPQNAKVKYNSFVPCKAGGITANLIQVGGGNLGRRSIKFLHENVFMLAEACNCMDAGSKPVLSITERSSHEASHQCFGAYIGLW